MDDKAQEFLDSKREFLEQFGGVSDELITDLKEYEAALLDVVLALRNVQVVWEDMNPPLRKMLTRKLGNANT
jgi:hypothetical protein